MSIKYAILGFLSRTPLTGYELKKEFTGSDTLYWSGSNNQIYRTLAQLHKDDLVTKEVHYQEKNPARKVYTITDKGRAELRAWLRSPPELPDVKQPFLIRLLWGDLLAPDELDDLLDGYEEELRVKLLMVQEQARRENGPVPQTERERYFRTMIDENWISFYRTQLNWLRDVRQGLSESEGK